MKRINTKDLNQNGSPGEGLTTPQFTHEAEEHAAPVEKLPKRRTIRGFLGTQIPPYWFLAIATVTALLLGAVGGAVAGLRDNQRLIESHALGGMATAEAVADVAPPAAPVAAAGETQPEPGLRTTRRIVAPSFRQFRQVPLRTFRDDDADVSRGRPVARKVGELSSSSLYWYRKRRVTVVEN